LKSQRLVCSVELAAKPVCVLESNPTRCAQKQIVVTVGVSQRASEAKILVKMQASAQSVQSEVHEVTVEAVAQVVHETTAIVVVIAMIVMIAASASRAQIVRLEPSEHPAKTYHQSTRPL
jgi:hypothetical protein